MSGAGFELDLGRCVGCGACVLACRIENRLPVDMSWRRVLPVNLARAGGGPTYHLSVACHHCDRPACEKACPTGVYEKRSDGIVVMRQERCIGCRYCEMACPFGAPTFDVRAGIMTKCHLCAERNDAGRKPACVDGCPTDALRFRPTLEGDPPEGAPGFIDLAECGPRIRFLPPRGARRAKAFEDLQEELQR